MAATNPAFPKSRLLLLIIIAVQAALWIASTNPAFADCEQAKLLASDGTGDDYFGCSIDISGDTAVIGAVGDTPNGIYSGSAYIFRFNGSNWVQQAKLLASDGSVDDKFGWSVAISGDIAVIGVHNDDDNGTDSGSAYIFRFNGSSWVQEAKLLASDIAGSEKNYFGWSVAISGDTAVIGAVNDDDNGFKSGSAYIFRFDGSDWTEETKLTASDGDVNDWFGYSVAISGGTVVIGAEGNDDNGKNSGSAYVFRFNGSSWVQETKLLASDGSADDWFGSSVAIFGDTTVIGAGGDDDNGDGSGSAYIFRFDGSNWIQEVKLLASDGAVGDFFGHSVDISGDTAVIGANYDDDYSDYSGSAYVFHFDGSNWVQQAKLLASDGARSDCFGESVAISGDTAVIGASGDDDKGLSSGSAYIFKLDGSTWEEKLLASDGAAGDHFSTSVAISGDTAIIGAHLDDNNFGSAYIFRFNGSNWVQQAKLLASDGAANNYFGVSVAISGDTAVIGAHRDDDNGEDSGSAYIFRFNGTCWTEEAKLLASDGAEGDYFGQSVAISGDTAVIGAARDDDNGSYSGSVYIFRFNGSSWTQTAKLVASDGMELDYFGYSVAISGDTAVIGAYGDDDNGDATGSAYIFRFDGSSWIEESKLLASDGAAEDLFGESVAISGDTTVIGALYDDDNGFDSGSAYVFRFNGSGWIEEAKLTASDGEVDDNFGGSVAISGDTVVIGADGDDDNGLCSGSAYIFGLSANPGNLDLDYDVDFADYGLFAQHWQQGDCGPCNCNRADFNRNGCADANDLNAIAENWLRGK